MLEAKQKRRDQLSIIANILEISLRSALKTQIMYRANLSYKQINEYLSFMIAKGLIAKKTLDGKPRYVVTLEGAGFLRRYHELTKPLQTRTTRAATPLSSLQAPREAP